jgi:glycosyltransferase involved in cell wall biosynthesis
MISCTIPPYVTSPIGDYAQQVASGLSAVADIRILTGQEKYDLIPNVRVEHCFNRNDPFSVYDIAKNIEQDVPDWIIIQYDPDTIVHRGVTPLPLVLSNIKKKNPRVKIATMVHECFKPVSDIKSAVQYMLLKKQLQMMCNFSDVMLFAIESWVEQFSSWIRPKAIAVHMPVGSMIPKVSCKKSDIRYELDILSESIVVGLFGRVGATSDLSWAVESIKSMKAAGTEVCVLYIGAWSNEVCSAFEGICRVISGIVSSEEVSKRFQAMDIYLLADHEGVSTRRTRLMTSLSHGVPTITTLGKSTDKVLRDVQDKALVLVPSDMPEKFVQAAVMLGKDAALRERIGVNAESFFNDFFSSEIIMKKWFDVLGLSNDFSFAYPDHRTG